MCASKWFDLNMLLQRSCLVGTHGVLGTYVQVPDDVVGGGGGMVALLGV